ncbi:MAG: NlpC/P60 family protein [Betaproteobacteria bacterium]|nr:NlpC/P60 family protein [Betaproteobacteria bacterium]
MTHNAKRAAVVAEAHSWLRTPYHHRGRIKGAGVDCAMLLAEVFERTGLVSRVDPGNYPPDIMMHQEKEEYLRWLKRYGHEVGSPQPGDVVAYKYGRCFSHGGIVVNWPTIIHAHRREGMVVLADGAQGEMGRLPRVFYAMNGVDG